MILDFILVCIIPSRISTLTLKKYFPDLHFSNIKEILNFNIQTKKCCLCLANDVECDSFKLIGGQSEDLYPNTKSITFTLVLPTLLLHNRVGFCDVVINTIKRDGETINKFHKIHFNTSLTNSCMKNYVIGMNLTNCVTRDLNPFRKCFPENCYEKYFGKRNFFNETRKLCEIVPDCGAKRDLIYDSVNNQCIDFDEIFTDEDLIKIKSGEYDNNSPPPEMIDQNVSFNFFLCRVVKTNWKGRWIHIL